MAKRKEGLGASYIMFSNNIIQGDGSPVKIGSITVNPTWEGNIILNTVGVGTIPQSGYVLIDPLLKQDNKGAYHIQAGSPAIGKSIRLFPYLTVDFEGQARSTRPDIGADQLSSNTISNHILTTEKVGPYA